MKDLIKILLKKRVKMHCFGHIHSCNGYLISKMDKIPEEGDEYEVTLEGYLFKVLSVENRRIRSVYVSKISDSDTQEEEETILEEKND